MYCTQKKVFSLSLYLSSALYLSRLGQYVTGLKFTTLVGRIVF